MAELMKNPRGIETQRRSEVQFLPEAFSQLLPNTISTENKHTYRTQYLTQYLTAIRVNKDGT